MSTLYADKHVKNGHAGILTSHFHDYYEIYYLITGEMRYIIADKIYEVSRGDIVLVPRGVIHNTSYGEVATERLLINFSIDTVSDPTLLSCFSRGLIHLSESSAFEFEALFKKFERESRLKGNRSEMLMRSYLTEMLVLFERCDNEGKKESQNAYSVIMQNAAEYINDNFSTDITLSGLSERFSLSKSHFSRKFKEVTGFGLSDYITLVRIKNAEAMIASGAKSITEVAFGCGFNDSSYFAKEFKKLIGTTPKKYQKSK